MSTARPSPAAAGQAATTRPHRTGPDRPVEPGAMSVDRTAASPGAMAFAPAVERVAESMAAAAPRHQAEARAATSPSAVARSWQGSTRYPGVDEWRDGTVRKGDLLVAGSPGHTGFFTTLDTYERHRFDAQGMFEAMQVAPRGGEYRPGLTLFEVTKDVPAAFSVARANPQHGPGGAEQIFLPDFEACTREVLGIRLVNRTRRES